MNIPFSPPDISQEEISRLMVGRDVTFNYDKEEIKAGRKVLEVKSQINKIPNKVSIISVIFIIPLILLIILGPFIIDLL